MSTNGTTGTRGATTYFSGGTAEASEEITTPVPTGGGTTGGGPGPGTGPDGIVDGTNDNDVMVPGYEDRDGDFVDGPDGDNDIIYAYDGDDYVDAGAGDDDIDGGNGNDTILGGDGNDVITSSSGADSIDGGTGIDTYDSSLSPSNPGETVKVYVDLDGDGTIYKVNDDTLDTIASVENFIAGEDPAEADEITITDGIAVSTVPTAIDGIADTSVGTFDTGSGIINFGGPGEPTISEILSGTYDAGSGPVSPIGSYQITSGDEDGLIGGISFANFETINFTVIEDPIVPCFTPGTLIGTARGEVPVEMLRVGDRIVTRDNGVQEIRWVGHKTLDHRTLQANPAMRPVLIRKGALGNGLPERDMLVSPNHRLLVANEQSSLYFEEREVLAAAKHLVNGTGITNAKALGTTYIHFMFDHHEVVLSDGTWTESFQPGDYSLKGIGDGQRDEIYSLFPELRDREGLAAYGAARTTLKRHEAAMLDF